MAAPAIGALVVMVSTAAAREAPAGDARFEYRYFAERIPLAIDASMVAAFADPGRGLDFDAALARHGIAAAGLVPSTVPGWTYATVPPGRSAVELADALAGDAAPCIPARWR
jgi:hypothetical protein